MPVTASPSTPFDAILFDVGGVMLTNGWDHKERAVVLAHFGLDKEAFEARHPAANDAWERDTMNIQDYLAATVFYEPRTFTPDEFLEAMKLQSLPLESNAMGILGELAASDKLLVGLLNNESRVLHEYRMEKFALKHYLDIQLSSCYLGMRKPDADIFKRALDILNKPPARVLFIDDREGNTTAAAAAGMHAIQFLSEDQLRQELTQLEVL